MNRYKKYKSASNIKAQKSLQICDSCSQHPCSHFTNRTLIMTGNKFFTTERKCSKTYYATDFYRKKNFTSSFFFKINRTKIFSKMEITNNYGIPHIVQTNE